MINAQYDVVFVADPRFPGGTSAALAVEIRSMHQAGYRTGILFVKGPLIKFPFQVNPQIRLSIDDQQITRIDPTQRISTHSVIIHHPGIFENRPTSNLQIEASKIVLVLHHPAKDRFGEPQYDISHVVKKCHGVFGRRINLAPVSDIVRSSLPVMESSNATLMEENWDNLLFLEDWPEIPDRKITYPVSMGRHSRPDHLKWPSTKSQALAAYPTDREKFTVRILGSDGFLEELFGKDIPNNWLLQNFRSDGIVEFLHSLDFYVYFHSDEWSEAYGRTILEALAVGLVVILPEHFEPIFGKAAVYCNPFQVRYVIDDFLQNPGKYRTQRTLARKYAKTSASSANFIKRMKQNDLLPDTKTDQTQHNLPPPSKRNILFMSSNGIGVGHLAQQIAIARRLPVELRSIFLTMCLSIEYPINEGYLTHFLPYLSQMGADPEDWNNLLAEELFEMLALQKPSVFAYDATSVFPGVGAALERFPDIFKIWVRRAMWRKVHEPLLAMSGHFDAIIEPGELAEEFDHGPTLIEKSEVLCVPPVLPLNPEERFSPQVAQAALDLPENLKVVSIQLGAGTNFDMVPMRRNIINSLLAHEDVFVLDIQSPLSNEFEEVFSTHRRYKKASVTPMFRYSKAFHASVCAAGYNTFHEQILGAIPTLFVPNEADQMDIQLNRARWAQLTGRGLLARRDYDISHTDALIETLLDDGERYRMISLCELIKWKNGADDIARFVEDHANFVRTDIDITRRVD